MNLTSSYQLNPGLTRGHPGRLLISLAVSALIAAAVTVPLLMVALEASSGPGVMPESDTNGPIPLLDGTRQD